MASSARCVAGAGGFKWLSPIFSRAILHPIKGRDKAKAMTLLCFVLDLRSISSPLLRDLKQALLQLANLYLLSSDRAGRKQRKEEIPFLRDRIGLCYLYRSGNSSSSATQLKIAHSPGERFRVRDFHHAVNNISLGNCLLDVNRCMNDSSTEEIPLKDLLNDNALYKWGGDDVPKKVIIICSSISAGTESLRRSLMDAAERCITVDFVVMEKPEPSLHYDDIEKFRNFNNSIYDLENCVIRNYLPDTWLLHGLVKKWFQELKNDTDEPLHAVLLFKNGIVNSINQIYCNLFPSAIQISDGFNPCQTCRCHAFPIDTAINSKTSSFCPVTHQELGASDLIDNAVRVGEQAVLFLPSLEGCSNPQTISTPLTFGAIGPTSLASLSEGLIMGTSFYVTPSSQETDSSDDSDKADQNVQLFYGLCRTLFLLDQGLVCSSTCNIETMQDGFQCYYILQPSERGPMLLRRLASSEEILPIPDLNQATGESMSEEVENSIRASLEKLELRDYNPLHHERGFHAKLNWLIKESLQFGTLSPPSVPEGLELNNLKDEQQPTLAQVSEGEMATEQNKENTSSSMTEHWEKLLIVDDLDSCYLSSNILDSKTKPLKSGALTKPLDEKTSKILERLEAPKQQKPKANLSSISKNFVLEQIKKPLVLSDSNSSQPLKPYFQKLKRKQM